jgi:hypothetical protein
VHDRSCSSHVMLRGSLGVRENEPVWEHIFSINKDIPSICTALQEPFRTRNYPEPQKSCPRRERLGNISKLLPPSLLRHGAPSWLSNIPTLGSGLVVQGALSMAPYRAGYTGVLGSSNAPVRGPAVLAARPCGFSRMSRPRWSEFRSVSGEASRPASSPVMLATNTAFGSGAALAPTSNKLRSPAPLSAYMPAADEPLRSFDQEEVRSPVKNSRKSVTILKALGTRLGFTTWLSAPYIPTRICSCVI